LFLEQRIGYGAGCNSRKNALQIKDKKSIMELVDYHHHHRRHHHPNCNALHAFLYLLAVERVLYLLDRG
jgi:hypothetical protein